MALKSSGDNLFITDAAENNTVLQAFQNEDGTVDVVIKYQKTPGVHVRLVVTLDYPSVDGASNWFRRMRSSNRRA